MKLISYYSGTDSLILVEFPPTKPYKYLYMIACRIRAKLLDLIVDEYQVDHEALIKDLRRFGIKGRIKVVSDPVQYTEPLRKKKHQGFNILFYYPGDRGNSKLWRWIYGYDIYLELKFQLPDVNFVVVNGKQDMNKVFPIIDFYLRPNRHDGASRLRQECDIQKIPYYWTQREPDINEARSAIERCKKHGR